MKILVTGAKGFIGTHVTRLLKDNNHIVFEYDLDSSKEELKSYIENADFVIHLAGVNRPLSVQEFYDGNTNFTKELLDLIKESKKVLPVIMSSSTQASLDNDYGKSKRMAESLLLESGLPVYVYRLANVFGRGCRPNYNSACATFCYNIAHDLPIQIRDENYVVHFNYVDDIANEFLNIIQNEVEASKEILSISPVYDCSLGHLAELLYYFKKEVESDKHLPLLYDEFELKLFKSFLWYLSDEGSSFNKASDFRGSFEELYKSKKWGQISDNVSFPDITKGGHYHTYKKEIFYTVIGECEIKQRNIHTDEMIVNRVSGDKPEPIDIIPEYTHSIKNIGKANSHTIMWISEIYNPETADTFREEVEK